MATNNVEMKNIIENNNLNESNNTEDENKKLFSQQVQEFCYNNNFRPGLLDKLLVI
jgi:hypothetical protein